MATVAHTVERHPQTRVVVIVARRSNLPATFAAPIVVVQHRTPHQESLLARVLAR